MTLTIRRTNPATGMVEMSDGKRTYQALGPNAEQIIRKHVEGKRNAAS
jgi:hypothetical protein